MKGKIKYVPKDVLETLGEIKMAQKKTDAEAFRIMADYSKIGLTLEKSFNWLWKRKR